MLLCCALVVFASTVQVAHSHAGGDITHPDCAFCATAHLVAQTVGAPAALAAVLVVSPTAEFAPRCWTANVSVFALFTRPPPTASTPA